MSTSPTRHQHERKGRLRRYLALAVAAVFVALGVAAALVPEAVIASSRYMVSDLGIYAAAALRTAIGVALLVVARGSVAPMTLRIMGVALLFAGLTMPILGADHARERIEWEAQHVMFLRVEGVLFLWAGFIVYKLSQPPRIKAAKIDHP